jgi:hypothetical protein
VRLKTEPERFENVPATLPSLVAELSTAQGGASSLSS